MWDQVAQDAYDTIKTNLCKPGLAIKAYDPALPLALHTDWSKNGIGAVLAQVATAEGSIEYMVACFSRSLNKHERNYSSYQGEMLAVVWACKMLRHYLYGVEFTIVTDHAPLVWLMSAKDLTGQHARWALMMQSFNFKIVHRAGVKHLNADALSRLPQPSTEDGTGARMDEEDEQPGRAAILALGPTMDEEEEGLTVNYNMYVQSRAQALVLNQLQTTGPHHAMSDLAPVPDELLADCNDSCTAHQDHPGDLNSASVRDEQGTLRDQADKWIATAAEHDNLHCSDDAGTDNGGAGYEHGAIDTTVLGPELVNDLLAGVCVLELFGGIATVLEGLLRSGVKVLQYYYVDRDKAARYVMHHRLRELQELYPSQLPTSTLKNVDVLPQDVTYIQSRHLLEAARLASTQAGGQPVRWFVGAGWPCQDFSPAGLQQGLRGVRASTYHALVQILRDLQRILVKPPAYLLENGPLQLTFATNPQLEQDFHVICSQLGKPLLLGAAQFNSYAYRLRNWWTNTTSMRELDLCTASVTRPPGLYVRDILDPGRELYNQEVWANRPPFYQGVNQGSLLEVLPTLASYPGSRAYREGAAGVLHLTHHGWDDPNAYTEPCPDERERCLGFRTGTTRAPGITENTRHRLTGACMDLRVVQSIVAITLALDRYRASPLRVPSSPLHEVPEDEPEVSQPLQDYVMQVALATVATLQDDHALPTPHSESTGAPGQRVLPNQRRVEWGSGPSDVWLDPPTLHYVQAGIHHHDTLNDTEERARVVKRAAFYVWVPLQADSPKGSPQARNRLLRKMADGSMRTCPAPGERQAIINYTHAACGHFGCRRTESLLLTSYWWARMRQDVEQVLSRCEVCDRARQTFNKPTAILSPLVIRGLYYRWSVDLAGPFPLTKRLSLRHRGRRAPVTHG